MYVQNVIPSRWNLSQRCCSTRTLVGLLQDYDGSQSVDVYKLLDEHNHSEAMQHHSIIQIDDDMEWSQMSSLLASVRGAAAGGHSSATEGLRR